LTEPVSKRVEAQELALDAMEFMHRDYQRAADVCRKALDVYPDCIDALTMLADIECESQRELVERLEGIVSVGRRELGADFLRVNRGDFWLLLNTRPFMRAMAELGCAAMDWGSESRTDQAIAIFEEMLDLNPNDNLGVRDCLAACYLARHRYPEAAALLDRYSDDDFAVPRWARILLAFDTDDDSLDELLALAREQNPHVEAYLTGRKRLPKAVSEMYSPGEKSEAVHCAYTLRNAWKEHPKAKVWLRNMCGLATAEP